MASQPQGRVLVPLVGGVVGLLVLVYALVVFVSGQTPEWTSATPVCAQPESIVYEQGSSYSVFVRTPRLSLSLSPGRPNAVVSRTGGGSYGSSIELNSATGVTCRWEPDHVVIVESDGIEHSVPARVFTGGR